VRVIKKQLKLQWSKWNKRFSLYMFFNNWISSNSVSHSCFFLSCFRLLTCTRVYAVFYWIRVTVVYVRYNYDIPVLQYIHMHIKGWQVTDSSHLVQDWVGSSCWVLTLQDFFTAPLVGERKPYSLAVTCTKVENKIMMTMKMVEKVLYRFESRDLSLSDDEPTVGSTVIAFLFSFLDEYVVVLLDSCRHILPFF